MIYKTVAYATILFGGTLAGGLVASLVGPIHIHLSSGSVTQIGALLGAGLSVLGCRLAIEHHEACERNRKLIQTLEHRVALLTLGPESATH